ncbi:uncharacterized protein LOC117333209 [Pecten maximus]|uniref:uncharacterized protein LOC117333209 n=1 Tax=Pecten maximus TaxID=6579 RepID=UPI00145833F5|nr:uncharacterized protein LOC117333209 [Pecten maximus]
MAAPTKDTPEPSTSKSAIKETNEKQISKFKDIWKIMPCEQYDLAYRICKDWRTKYYHRYWDGVKDFDCDPLKKDVEMCEELAEHESIEAYEHLLKVEEAKRQKRLHSVQNNDVWEYRASPPVGWYSNMLNNHPATVSQVEGVKPICKEHHEPFLNRHLKRYNEKQSDEDLTNVKPKMWLKPLKESLKDNTSMCVIS